MGLGVYLLPWKWKSLCCVWLFVTPMDSPWNSPGQNTAVGISLSLLQGIFLNPRNGNKISHIAGRFFTSWATREAHLLHCVSVCVCVCESCSVVSDSLWPHGLYSPQNSSGQNTGVGISLLQGIFPTQVLNPGLPHCRWIVYQLSHKGLWKLPDGRDWLRGKLGLGLMAGAMFNKSLVQFSIDGWSCVPSLLFTWGQTMVEVTKTMATSFKRSPAFTAALSAPRPAAGHHQPTPLLETPGHSQASLGQPFVGSLLLSPGSRCTIFCLCPPRVYFPVLCKFWQLYFGINCDLLQQGLAIAKSAAPRAPVPVAVHCWPVAPKEMLKHSSVSLCGFPGSWCAQSLFLVGIGFDSKHEFTPPTTWLLFLWPWVWGISSPPLTAPSSCSHHSLLQPLILLHRRANTLKTTITEN